MACMRNRIRLYIILPILTFLLTLAPYSAFSSQSKIKVDIKVNAGYDNIARVTSTVPFRITLTNMGVETSGEVQVVLSDISAGKKVYAIPFFLPVKSEKQMILNIPLDTVNKKVEVRLVKGSKVIKTIEYEFSRIISPEIPVVGILCEYPDSFRNLNGISLSLNRNPSTDMFNTMRMNPSMTIVNGKTVMSTTGSAEVIILDADTLPDDIKAMDGFNVLIISDFDTSVLSGKQIAVINEWVKNGNLLFIGTGANWKKVYSGLNDKLKPFRIDASVDIPFPKTTLQSYGYGDLLDSLRITAGNTGNGETILKEGERPLGISYKYGKGAITVLTFDPSLAEISDWTQADLLWGGIINSARNITASEQPSAQQAAYTGRPLNYYDFQQYASSVPEDQAPPFMLLTLLAVIYALIAGPGIYLFLKRKDKRDFSWVLIPAIAFVFLMIMYIAGFKTRYTTAVLNNVSMIYMNQENKTAEINSYMGAFNNKHGKMKIEYDQNMNLETYNNMDYNYMVSRMYSSSSSYSSSSGIVYGSSYPSSYSSQQNPADEIITSKITYSDRIKWELYNAGLWQPKILSLNKDMPIKEFAVDDISFDNGRFKAVIRNLTEFNLQKSFIVIGDNYISTGDIAAGRIKTIDVDMYGKDVQHKAPSDWQKNTSQRNITQLVLGDILNRNQQENNVMFFALSYDIPGLNIVINNKKPKYYNANIIYSKNSINYQKGSDVVIPAGVLKPTIEGTRNASFNDPFTGGVMVAADGDVYFKFTLPDGIDIKSMRIRGSTIQRSNVSSIYSQGIASGQIHTVTVNGQTRYINSATGQILSTVPAPSASPSTKTNKTAKNKYIYSIFNYKTSQYEVIKPGFTTSSNVNDYISSNRQVMLIVNTVLDNKGIQKEFLGVPGLEIKGVVK